MNNIAEQFQHELTAIFLGQPWYRGLIYALIDDTSFKAAIENRLLKQMAHQIYERGEVALLNRMYHGSK